MVHAASDVSGKLRKRKGEGRNDENKLDLADDESDSGRPASQQKKVKNDSPTND